MFEKEAEEYREKEKDKGFYWVTQEMEQSELDTIVDETFKDGATFGYNKAKEEMQEQGLALQSDMDKTIEQNIALKNELAKANEWHYVKDELPPVEKEYGGRSKPVLVVSKEKEMQYAQYVEKEKTWARGICAINFEPYAWKEIVLPKEIKEK